MSIERGSKEDIVVGSTWAYKYSSKAYNTDAQRCLFIVEESSNNTVYFGPSGSTRDHSHRVDPFLENTLLIPNPVKKKVLTQLDCFLGLAKHDKDFLISLNELLVELEI